MAAVARRLGVAAGTLRTWDRRYGVGPTGHVAGARRRYTAGDLARLTVMRRLMLEGVSPADAALVAVRSDPSEDVAPPVEPDGGRKDRPTSRAGGGRVVPLRDASPAARGLARAAMALDSAGCTAVIARSLARRGVVRTWDDLLLPVLSGVGERWRTTGTGVEVEHLLSECAEDALRQVTRRATRGDDTRPVLLAALEQEEHRLPLHALAAALAERSVAVRMLGARLPVGALASAVTRTGAAVVFVWSQGATGRPPPARLATVPAVRPSPTVLLGGPGWSPDRLPARTRWCPDLASATTAVTAALGVGDNHPR
ncbi:MAG: MerR family transcriptional regulator [Actinomycetes bacterium]